MTGRRADGREAKLGSSVGLAGDCVVLGLWHIVWVLIKNTPLREALQVVGLAMLTMLRVFV